MYAKPREGPSGLGIAEKFTHFRGCLVGKCSMATFVSFQVPWKTELIAPQTGVASLALFLR